MKKEIGSEFWDIPLASPKTESIIPSHAQWVLSGRVALSFIIQDIQSYSSFRTVAMPSWCCHTMVEPFIRSGIEVHFYPVYRDNSGHLRQDLSQIGNCDSVLILDYFGYVRPVERDSFRGVVIRDVTHSLFCGVPKDADYIFGSLRKWAGFLTGGYGWKRDGSTFSSLPSIGGKEYIGLRRQAMEQKSQYMRGERKDKNYLSLFAQAEELLESGISAAGDREDIRAAQYLDIEFMKNRRRKNAAMIQKELGELCLFRTLEEDDFPLFVPILVPDGKRDELRRYLIRNEIYCPVHWPVSEYHKLDKKTRAIYDDELSLVCDQRYDEKDMERMIDTIRAFWKVNRTSG